MYPTLRLKAGKEANVAFRHPWVFSGALEPGQMPAHGSLVHIADREGRVLGTGTFSSKSGIAVRVFAPGEFNINAAYLSARLREADARRARLGYGPGTDTTGYRVLFGESDGVPGLVVDRYADVIVFQLSTAGMDALRESVIAAITDVFAPTAVVERSDIASRKEEGLEPVSGVVRGTVDGPVAFLENGVSLTADVVYGQKTGFFLDQKVLRSRVESLCKDASVLNVFSYTGAASLAALRGGAKSVHNVDSSEEALAKAREHARTAGFGEEVFTTEVADAFRYLGVERAPEYDVVMIDPPALIKSHKDTEEGKKAYHFLNRAAMRLVKDGGIFITSSCSHFMSEDDLAFTLRRASVQAGITLRVLDVVRQAPDHPQSVYFPEATYLKSFICEVRRP